MLEFPRNEFLSKGNKKHDCILELRKALDKQEREGKDKDDKLR